MVLQIVECLMIKIFSINKDWSNIVKMREKLEFPIMCVFVRACRHLASPQRH